ncbi:transglycosylase domain-containing protein [Halopseudomonas pelagia]|uniref:transglycosylase domain-containing protein n=1 Tax=Halopseudomonas pelagia TaxID=553151 RepID=UPI0003A8EE95|nr:transglycosylase domain-containing protein [Halopseudomonas pelagia]
MRHRPWLLLGIALVALAWLASEEIQHSYYQSRFVSEYASQLTYELMDGPSERVIYPEYGPFDHRYGYTALPVLLPRLQSLGYSVVSQARFSDPLLRYVEQGFFAPFDEKTQSGLTIRDCRGEPVFAFHYPERNYADYQQVPPLLAEALLFIEDRDLLSSEHPNANPAVNWLRLAGASVSLAGSRFNADRSTPGASTIATQIEKFRHSREGRTQGLEDKLMQMGSASVRAYKNGPNTMEARRQLVLDYINTVPLAAAPGHGEVNGVGDGLWVWFAEDIERFSRRLTGDDDLMGQAVALRQGLALMIAQRRPSYYLLQGRDDLNALIDSHLRLLTREGVIEAALRDEALAQPLVFRNWAQDPLRQRFAVDKAIMVARARLSGLLGQSQYAVDRFDLQAETSLHSELQQQISAYLESLATAEMAGQIGLLGERLLSPEKVADVRYSFTLMQRGANGNQVRVQTDNTGLPFDLNEGSKLELGSTAKLRVLTTYLEIIAELYEQLSGADQQTLAKLRADNENVLAVWAAGYLSTNPQASLAQTLEAALERRYSANPDERFFTGGGVQRFGNFRREDNFRNPTLRESLRESINLPFVRLMRDILRYAIYQSPESSMNVMRDDNDPARKVYLARFADKEGQTFLLRFWRKYGGLSEQERLDVFLDGLRPTATRLAAVHRYLYPEADETAFKAFMQVQPGMSALGDTRLESLYRDYGPGRYDLPDQGYIARVHPLELWLVGYLRRAPDSSFSDAVQASQAERQEVYGWLFRTRHRSARDSRIRTMLEVEAFLEVHRRWKRVGYPFEHLVPSLGTALGSSGDRPAALAELMGVIQNDGLRFISRRINDLHFAAGTPYEARLQRPEEVGVQVMHADVAGALKGVLSEVVDGGTARRLQGTFVGEDGTAIALGGKTGTGDNRIHSMTASGRSTSSQVMNRTATFVFFLGDEHFGTLTAFVPGKAADSFRFTSALPVQVLKGMAPILQSYLQQGGAACQVE